MSKVGALKLPYEELKSIVTHALSKYESSFKFKQLCDSVGKISVDMNLINSPYPPNHQAFDYSIQKQDEDKVREIIWDFIVQRVVTIGNYNGDSWPWLSLTEYGKKALTSELPIPNDPSGYLNRIKKEIPDLDYVIEVYLMESLKTFNINQLLSSTITLGCASEKALLELIATYAETFNNISRREQFLKRTEGRFIKTQFDEFDKNIRGILSTLPNDLKDRYSGTLNGVFEMIRSNRNAAGHPSGQQIDKDTLFANLQVFIPYCKYIYELRSHFNENKHE